MQDGSSHNLDRSTPIYQVTPHKNDHDYRVVDNLSFPILHSEWGADEEILLLEAIDIYGILQ